MSKTLIFSVDPTPSGDVCIGTESGTRFAMHAATIVIVERRV